ncbi:MAG TPA: DNA-binding protein [Candidatus Scalindua sp.]|nr:DNA-binding protein [Candidatus Scalindua sp.]
MKKREFKPFHEYDFSGLDNKLDTIQGDVNYLKEPFKPIYHDKDLEELFLVSRRTIQNWRDEKKISFTKVGNKVFYTREDVESFLKKYHNESI